MSNMTFDPEILQVWREIDPSRWQGTVSDIIATFFRCSRPQIEELERALRRDEIQAVRELAHTLKSSFGNVGAQRASRMYGLLELCARKRDRARIKMLAPHLAAVAHEAFAAVEAFHSEIQAA